jgi:hypothetical protein
LLLEHAQVVTDEMWGAREQRFPEHTPATREYYLLRSIFEEHFPSPSALATVPKARPDLAPRRCPVGVACSVWTHLSPRTPLARTPLGNTTTATV